MIELNKIYQGHVLEMLKTFPDESVDTVCTSPPYYGLRSYGTTPQIWGGREDCQHEWIDTTYVRNNDKTAGQKQRTSPGSIGRDEPVNNAFCIHCSASRGELGLEPSFELYLEHLWMIFDEIYRVLKKAGSCWVNMGDSYGGSGGSTGHTSETKNLGRKTFDYGAYPTYANTSKYQAKSLLQIPSRFAIGMTSPNWELRDDLTEEERNYVYSELIKRGII